MASISQNYCSLHRPTKNTKSYVLFLPFFSCNESMSGDKAAAFICACLLKESQKALSVQCWHVKLLMFLITVPALASVYSRPAWFNCSRPDNWKRVMCHHYYSKGLNLEQMDAKIPIKYSSQKITSKTYCLYKCTGKVNVSFWTCLSMTSLK